MPPIHPSFIMNSLGCYGRLMAFVVRTLCMLRLPRTACQDAHWNALYFITYHAIKLTKSFHMFSINGIVLFVTFCV